jgi:hypothetical protein
VRAAASPVCFDESKPQENQLVIDANTGEIISGNTSYPRNTGISVVVTRKNPFKYVYTYAADVQPIDESGDITALFKLISPLSGVSGLWDTTKDSNAQAKIAGGGSPKVGGPPTPAPPVCSGDEKAILDVFASDLSKLSTQAAKLGADTKTAAAEFDATQKIYADFVKLADVDRLDCAAADAAARSSEPTLKKFSVGKLPTDVGQHAEEVGNLQKLIGIFKPAQEPCREKRARQLEVAGELSDQAKAMSAAVAKMVEGKKSFDATAAVIDSALASDPYYEVHEIAPHRRPSTAKITVARSPRTKPDQKTTVAVDLELGEPYFALTLGLGVSSIAEQEFGQVDSLVPDGSGGTTLGKRFAVVNDSKPTPLGAVLLHANLWRWCKKHDAVGALSLGVSIGDNDKASTFGYLFGVSAGFLDRRFYVTAAYHLRSVERIGGGFSPNDVVPTGLTTVPTQRTFHDGAMIVFSYRVK